jgi:hypothetical protein
MSNPKPGKAEFTVQGACFECMYLGWFPSESDKYGLQVERCDCCSVFASDDEAQSQVLRLAAQALKSPRRRTGKRFKMLRECLEVMADQAAPPFWNEKPSPDTLRMIVRHMKKATGNQTTMLGLAYCLQGMFIHCPTNGEDAEHDSAYVQNNLDRDELEKMLRDAGCVSREECGVTLWSGAKKKAA